MCSMVCYICACCYVHLHCVLTRPGLGDSQQWLTEHFQALVGSSTEDWGITVVDCMLFTNFYYYTILFTQCTYSGNISNSLHDGLTELLTNRLLSDSNSHSQILSHCWKLRLSLTENMTTYFIYLLSDLWLGTYSMLHPLGYLGCMALCPSTCIHLSWYYTACMMCTFWTHQCIVCVSDLLSFVPVLSLFPFLASNIVLLLFWYCTPQVCHHRPHGQG